MLRTLAHGMVAMGLSTSVACGAEVRRPSPTINPHPPGAGCSANDQCASEVCTADTIAGTCGVCIVPHALGEGCDGMLQGCASSARCVDGACQTTKVPPGGSCKVGPLHEDIRDCDDSAYCVSDAGLLNGEPATCIDRPAIGEPCDWMGISCALGARCEQGTCTAIETRSEGESCGQSNCASGLFCFDGICKRATLSEGDECGLIEGGDFVPNDCGPGLTCGNLDFPNGGSTDTEHCLAKPIAGKPCLLGACGDGLYCREVRMANGDAGTPICADALGEGAACDRRPFPETECAAGLDCRAGVCQPAC